MAQNRKCLHIKEGHKPYTVRSATSMELIELCELCFDMAPLTQLQFHSSTALKFVSAESQRAFEQDNF
jgi:hypothetical protein